MNNLFYKLKRLEQILLYKEERIKAERDELESQYNYLKEKIKTTQQEIIDIQNFQKEYQNCINQIGIQVKNIIIWLCVGLMLFFTNVPFICAVGAVSTITAIMCNCKKIIEYRKKIKHTNMSQLVQLLAEKEEYKDTLKNEAKKLNEDIFILYETINEIRSDIRICKNHTSQPIKPLLVFEKEKINVKDLTNY